MLEGGVSFVWREDLNVSPGKADEIWLEPGCRLTEDLSALTKRVERQIQNLLPDVRAAPMDKVRQVGDPDRVDLLAWQEDVENGPHKPVIRQSSLAIRAKQTRPVNCLSLAKYPY